MTREDIWDVSELLDGSLDTGARPPAGVPGAVDHARDCHGRDAGAARHVSDGAHGIAEPVCVGDASEELAAVGQPLAMFNNGPGGELLLVQHRLALRVVDVGLVVPEEAGVYRLWL